MLVKDLKLFQVSSQCERQDVFVVYVIFRLGRYSGQVACSTLALHSRETCVHLYKHEVSVSNITQKSRQEKCTQTGSFTLYNRTLLELVKGYKVAFFRSQQQRLT